MPRKFNADCDDCVREGSAKPKPRSTTAWAIMHKRTRAITGVYVGGYNKDYVIGDCNAHEIPVRVRITAF